MPSDTFADIDIDTWVFDLDNTLYPPDTPIFSQVNARMTAYVRELLGLDDAAADRLRHEYWVAHGTTLAGLMAHHQIAPGPYLEAVHDIDFSVLTHDPGLAHAIADLAGRRIVYTNGSAPYAENVLAALGLSGLFDAVYGVEHAGYHPKPEAAAFERVFGADGLIPDRSVMFEDDARNLRVPHAMGLRTVHVSPVAARADHIDHHTADLRGFLARCAG